MSYLPRMPRQERAEWRDETKKCVLCQDVFWPGDRTTKKRWESQVTCPGRCSQAYGSSIGNQRKLMAKGGGA
jgi:hypothetical protein